MKKTAIVTGGSKGIGYAISTQLGLDGYNVVIFARQSQEANQAALNELTALSIDWEYVQGDLGDSDARQRLVTAAVGRFGAIHVLVNNAGVAPLTRNDLLDMTEESFDRVVGINTKGTMFLTQLVARQMISQEIPDGVGKRGTIVNVSSCSSVVSSINRGEYCISKAGMSMLTTLYADRLAREGILVHEVRPGVIETDMTRTVKEKYDDLFSSGLFPIARWGRPEDVAHAVSALVSDKFLYSTGNYIDIDGGFHIQRL
ncbi:3-ketoacyl-ACP reductase [Parasphaerochaeta coccoides]|uniref:3-oxoacyl-(Acyl-carrier-protein) reductase n=1 Tax=Parasphaerochaeta coccoides (strain ATCC BAA-1237 / DSM 17374 / SPN1) TaxID=760011 RepID=F4GJM8_PARC1|nr:3-ketoacyl-ACP reductase [Parasphaerochaeta coccoides]AEC02775.1 3-oxoacyl-(acyl-carrier-protein) reductase [Parasphaerochaeta coccoides DSM 17374]